MKIFIIFIIFLSISHSNILTSEEEIFLTKKINSTLPKKLDDITQIVDFYIASDKFVYTYEIKNINESSKINFNKIILNMNNAMCTYPNTKNLIYRGLIFRYIYRNEYTKKFLFSFEIDKNSCKHLVN